MKELEQIEKAAAVFNQDIQFYHDIDHGYTYAIGISFTREDLLESVHHFDQSIIFNIGISILHPNDVYCKKTGRYISACKMKPVMLFLKQIYKSTCDEDKLYLEFKDRVSDLVYTFRVNSKSEKPHFIKVY